MKGLNLQFSNKTWAVKEEELQNLQKESHISMLLYLGNQKNGWHIADFSQKIITTWKVGTTEALTNFL